MNKQDVLSYFGGYRPAARALVHAGHPISYQAIQQWHELVPERRARQLHDLTEGLLAFHPLHYSPRRW